MASITMIYNKGAFNNFDAIQAVTNYQFNEINEISQQIGELDSTVELTTISTSTNSTSAEDTTNNNLEQIKIETSKKLNIYLEKMILKDPSQWILTHNRWK